MGSTGERYEAGSVEWVSALRDFVTAKAGGRDLRFKASYSAEYTDPPAHLLRRDGRNSIGWCLRIDGSKVEVLDGPRHNNADIASIQAYDPMALALRMADTEFRKWYAENGLRLEAEGKVAVIGDQNVSKLMVFMQPLRNEFYAKYSARRGE